MTGNLSDRIDKLLEDVASLREQVANLEEQIDELKAELKPVFFQATLLKGAGMAAASGLALFTCVAAAFPSVLAAMARALVGALLKGGTP